MATAKKAAAKPAQTASKSTALVPWEQEMKATAVAQAAKEKVFGSVKSVNVQGGVMMIDNEAVEGNEIRVIVLGSVFENQYYDGPYDPKNPTVPVCYAFGDPEAEDPEEAMAPVAEDVDDQQHSDCASCSLNVMGSATVGRGKACKNIRRLALITEDALESPEALAEAEVRQMKLPVMSVKYWSKYVRDKLANELGRTSYGVITLIKVVPDPTSQWKILFQFEELVNFDADLWGAMKKKADEAVKGLITPYPHQADLDAAKEAQKPAPRGGKAQPMKPAGRVAQKAVAGKGGKKY